MIKFLKYLLINNITKILFFIFIILLFYTIYKSEFVWLGKNRSYYISYYFLSLIILLITILSFILKKEFKIYLVILFSSILTSLYMFEIYYTLDWQSSKIKTKSYYEKTGKEYDKRSKVDVYKNLKIKNKDYIITFSPQLFLTKNDLEVFPLSGHSYSNTLHCNENGYYSEYISDRYGFNNPDKEWDNKKIEFLLIGDSFVHGACVNRPNDMASNLRNQSGKSVLNLGYSGNGPLLQYATLKEYYPINVKNILWFYYEDNDNIDLSREITSPILLKYLEDDKYIQNLKSIQKKIDLIIKGEIEKHISRDKNKLINFLKLTRIRFLINKILINEEKEYSNHKIFKELIKKTKEFAELKKSNFYFIYLPTFERYNSKNYDNTNYLKIKNILKDLEIPFINIDKEVFEKEDNPLELFPFGMSGHYNEAGYSKISKAIYKFVNKN